jgi:hypothetical protein
VDDAGIDHAELPYRYDVEVVGLLASPRHRYDGRPLDPLATRRNVVLRGAEVEALLGVPFSLDCGAGEVLLAGGRPANPCAWMDTVLAPGAHRGMRGRGGVRCAPRTDGVLRLGPAVLRSAVPLDPARAGDPVRPVSRQLR